MIRLLAPEGNAERMEQGDSRAINSSSTPWTIHGTNGGTCLKAMTYFGEVRVPVSGFVPNFTARPNKIVSSCPPVSLCKKPSKLVVGGSLIPSIASCRPKEDELILLAWIVESPGYLWEHPTVVGGGEIVMVWSSNSQGDNRGPVKHLIARLTSEWSIVSVGASGRRGTPNDGISQVRLFGWSDTVSEFSMSANRFKGAFRSPDHKQCLGWLSKPPAEMVV